jgi:hypothetical protein
MVEDKNRSFKADIVFPEISLILVLIPLEAHGQSAFLSSVTQETFRVNTSVRTEGGGMRAPLAAPGQGT